MQLLSGGPSGQGRSANLNLIAEGLESGEIAHIREPDADLIVCDQTAVHLIGLGHEVRIDQPLGIPVMEQRNKLVVILCGGAVLHDPVYDPEVREVVIHPDIIAGREDI